MLLVLLNQECILPFSMFVMVHNAVVCMVIIFIPELPVFYMHGNKQLGHDA